MIATNHFLSRSSQRGINFWMIDYALEYGEYVGDKIVLTKKRLLKLIARGGSERPHLLKLLDKGGITVVCSGDTLITTYTCNHHGRRLTV